MSNVVEADIDDINKQFLKMLVIIVNRSDTDRTTKFLRDKHLHFHLVCLAHGTAGSELLDMLGLGSSDKALIMCFSKSFRIAEILAEISEDLKLDKKGKGIAFSIPLIGVAIPNIASVDRNQVIEWNQKIEKEVDIMNNNITHSVILAIINSGFSEELVETAKAAGARGGTVINARSTGSGETLSFFGMTVQPEREVVAILVSRENKDQIMDAIEASHGANSKARGIVLALPVDAVSGMTNNK